jgi:hemoglobin-like flavoprotein
MTHEQVQLVQSSFGQLEARASDVALAFYNRLFELDPSLRRLFPNDIRAQGRKLMQVLAVAVRGLADPAPLVPMLYELGRRHASYGVREQDYDTVGAALVSTLERELGDAFTQQVKNAWLAVYSLVASTMQAAAQPIAAERRSA